MVRRRERRLARLSKVASSESRSLGLKPPAKLGVVVRSKLPLMFQSPVKASAAGMAARDASATTPMMADRARVRLGFMWFLLRNGAGRLPVTPADGRAARI